MLWNTRRLATLAQSSLEKAATLAAAVLDITLKKAHMEVPATRRLTGTERVRTWKVVGLDGHWKDVSPKAAA
jgi:methionine-rich copper-binding protein CopC